MADAPVRPRLFTIPAHRSFADALVAGLLRAHGRAPDALARGLVLLPNNRAIRTLRDAFVRASGGGLLLPRMVAIGDPELGERIGGALDPIELADPLPPAIEPLDRQLLLAGMLAPGGESFAERMRMADSIAAALDALTVEEVGIDRLAALRPAAGELAGHWARAYDRFEAVARRWPALLAERGLVDLAERRNRLLRAAAARWARQPPDGFVVAAGITTAAPAVAALLARVAMLEKGAVVFPALALADTMADEEWAALGPDADGRGQSTHPMYHLKRLLDRMGFARAEVDRWRAGGKFAASAARGRAVVHAMAAPRFTDKWSRLKPSDRRLTGVRALELADPAGEAQAIALALRGALEVPGRTAALVTPDRALAGRVSAHLGRWGIVADDSAGKPLAMTPAGTLLLSIASAVEEALAPVALLALLKHPLVAGPQADGGDADRARRAWLADARTLDLALRGPRPAPGLAGIDALLAAGGARMAAARASWARLRPTLETMLALFDRAATLAGLAAALREAAMLVAGSRAFAQADGRAAAALVEAVETSAEAATARLAPGEAAPLVRALLDKAVVRPPYGAHPRIAILGLLEARLAQADLMILGGLNEGVWPGQASPDPWLAPRLRRELGLAGLDHGQGLAAHDFMSALGAPRVLVTRARRDARAPTVASRLWLRLEALTGGLPRDHALARWADAIDRAPAQAPAARPAPVPPGDWRPRRIAVTDVDRLRADPYAFYAKAVLGLRRLDPVDADHSAAWRGTAVHDVLEAWFKEDRCDPERLRPRAEALLADGALHPMLRALWTPRLLEAIDWIGASLAADRAEDRVPVAAEDWGEAEIAGVTLYGKADRIDRDGEGRVGIVDYKTGQPPRPKAIAAGFAMQLGLLGLIAERGGFSDEAGAVGMVEYWSLAKKAGQDGFGYRADAAKGVGAEDFLAATLAHFTEAAGRWLTGDEPFTAQLHPEYAPYGDYDQLMRLEEWYGRDSGDTGAAAA